MFSLSFILLLVAFLQSTIAADFGASSKINKVAKKLYEYAEKTLGEAKDSEIVGEWEVRHGGPKSKIVSNWNEGVFYFIADMDVDCDGVSYKCKGNDDGQPQTSWGKLDAKKVPYFVIPQAFLDKVHEDHVKPNALGAIVCNGKIFYGIFGDTNGDTPQVIGEASWALAQACFPDEHLDGGKGHDKVDVLYIVFGKQVPKGVGKEKIDIGALKKLGNKQMKKLLDRLDVKE